MTEANGIPVEGKPVPNEKVVDQAHVDVEMAKPSPAPSAPADKAGGNPKRKKLILIAVATFFAVAVGVGVGVGVSVGTQGKKHDGPYMSLDLGMPGRTYFVAADEITWNYAPGGGNLCYMPNIAATLLPAGTTRVGGTFVKAQYREYTDSSFGTLKNRSSDWQHLGNVGPVMYGAVGDVIRVVFRNNLTFPVNIFPAGGLTAWDGSNRVSARTAPVPPGATATYLWTIPSEAGPVAGSTVSSRLWLYTSTVDPSAHDNAGLVGPIIVTAAGKATDGGGRPTDVDREVVTIFQVVQEKASAMFGRDTDPSLTAGTSYTKMAINGFTWCNMPSGMLTLRVGQRVRWHVASIGSGDSLHNYHWHGHGVELNGHHVDQFTAIPGASYSVNIQPDEPGRWMFHCHVNYHMDGGMVVLYEVEGSPAPFNFTGVERVYYVAAEPVEWSYTGENNTQDCGVVPVAFDAVMTDTSPNGNQFVNGPSTDPVRLGYKYTKTLFREYTDGSFTTLKNRTEEESYLGFLGPILRATVGDKIKVVLLNRAAINISMHPHGVRYSKANEGTLYEDGTSAAEKLDDVVMPGQNYTYKWLVSDRAGPGPKDPSSMLWMYHGHLDETAETYAGLAGGIIVTAKDKLDPNSAVPSPGDVDREIVIYFTVVDEIKSANFMENLRTRLPDNGTTAAILAANSTLYTQLVTDASFAEHMLKHGINGFMYCHMPRLTFKQGQKVRLHVMVLGTLEDMHTPNMGGPRFDYNGQHTDSIQISPGGMTSSDVLMTSPGDYELQCRVADHVLSGMRAKYTVSPDPTAANTTLSGVNRTYYIAAEPVEWNYAPRGYQQCTDQIMWFDSQKYITRSGNTIGSKYRKAVYREYTDATFTTRKSTPSYLGTMGPTITVEVGDRLIVHLRNTLTDLPDWPVNIAPGGGLVAEGGEGENCKAVAAGESCVYRWIVPASAGPAAVDFNTAVYGYTSDTDVAVAPSAGLAGALVVAGSKQLVAATGLPFGVDMMVPLYWQVVNEEMSPYFDANAEAAGINVTAVDENEFLSGNFHEGNLMHSINGYVYCNLPDLNITANANVRWLLVAYGTEGDFHSPYFAGQSVVSDHTGYSTLASLMPSIARVADMKARDRGSWLLACSVHDHYNAGMLAQFNIK